MRFDLGMGVRHAITAAAALLLMIGAVPALASGTESSADLPGFAPGVFALPAPDPLTGMRPARAELPAPAPAYSGRFELVGSDPLLYRGMNAALAVSEDGYAYVGYRSDGTKPNSGVMVVDVRDPAAPAVVGQIGPPNEANPSESSRELRILPDHDLLLVLNHGCSELIHACANAAAAGRNLAVSNIRFYDIRGANAAAPKLVSTYLPSRTEAQTPHEFFAWTDPADRSRVLLYQSTPSTQSSGRDQMIVTDISRARDGVFTEIAAWKTTLGGSGDRRLHSLTVSEDGRRAYLAYLGGGFLVADTSDFAEDRAEPAVRLITDPGERPRWGDPGAHSAVQLPGRPDWAMTTDEVYGRLGGLLSAHGCPWGWPRFIDISDAVKPVVRAGYRPPWNTDEACAEVDEVRNNFSSFASHNPTLTRNLAILSWHSGGLQAIDTSDPANPRPAAGFWPEPLPAVATEDPALSSGTDKVVVWSFPVIVNGLVYVVDLRNGLYVLRYKGPFEDEVADAGFLDGNSNSGDLLG